MLVALLAGVDVLPAAEAPALPKENPGAPVAAPKRLPDAGADDVVLLLGALEELGFPKLNDILGVRSPRSVCSNRGNCRSRCV
jgi:hypothetical protein